MTDSVATILMGTGWFLLVIAAGLVQVSFLRALEARHGEAWIELGRPSHDSHVISVKNWWSIYWSTSVFVLKGKYLGLQDRRLNRIAVAYKLLVGSAILLGVIIWVQRAK